MEIRDREKLQELMHLDSIDPNQISRQSFPILYFTGFHQFKHLDVSDIPSPFRAATPTEWLRVSCRTAKRRAALDSYGKAKISGFLAWWR